MMDSGDIWEEEIYASAKASERRAWRVAIGTGVLAFLGLGHSALTLSKHQIEPVVIAIDKVSGLHEVRSRLGTVTLDDNEAVTQSYLFRYIRDRETYDPMDNVPRIEAVYAESEGDAADSLAAVWGSENPNHPTTLYGDRVRVTVAIRSISFIDADTASVQLRKTVQSGTARDTSDFVATVDFRFATGGERLIEAVWANPLGFTVTAYRIDAMSFGESDA